MTDQYDEPGRPWERRENETDAQWLAFMLYRDQGLGRTVEEAWDAYADERDLKSDKAPQHFWNWVNENDWNERCRAYDRFIDEKRRAEHEKKRREARATILDNINQVAQRLMLTALSKRMLPREVRQNLPGEIDDPGVREFNAMIEVLDRAGIDAPDKVEISGDMTQRHEGDAPGTGIDPELFANLLQMDDEDRDRRIDELDDMMDELEGDGSDE